jgi:hypothetical protein
VLIWLHAKNDSIIGEELGFEFFINKGISSQSIFGRKNER